MNTTDTIRDLVSRVRHSLAALPPLEADRLNAHPCGHPNSPAWLLWHTGREIDMQLSRITGAEELWTAQDHRGRLGLGPLGDTMGYGHTSEQARSLLVDTPTLLRAYVVATLDAVDAHAATVDDAAWDDVVDHYEGEPVTRQVRITSLLLDALEHLAQVAYVAGMPGDAGNGDG